MFLVQNVNTRECRAVLHHCMLDESSHYKRCDISEVERWRGRDVVPVGSVEFIHAYMDAHGISRPMFSCYPGHVKHNRFYKRDIMAAAKVAVDGVFVKPMETKLFTGFVYPETDEENMAEFRAVPDQTDCWISEPINFISEYRYCVQNSKILGWGRYDQNEGDAPRPDAKFVFDAIGTLVSDCCAVDIGVTDKGESAVVEVNNCYAIGLYGDNMTPTKYANFLKKGWKEIYGRSEGARRSISGYSTGSCSPE